MQLGARDADGQALVLELSKLEPKYWKDRQGEKHFLDSCFRIHDIVEFKKLLYKKKRFTSYVVGYNHNWYYRL